MWWLWRRLNKNPDFLPNGKFKKNNFVYLAI